MKATPPTPIALEFKDVRFLRERVKEIRPFLEWNLVKAEGSLYRTHRNGLRNQLSFEEYLKASHRAKTAKLVQFLDEKYCAKPPLEIFRDCALMTIDLEKAVRTDPKRSVAEKVWKNWHEFFRKKGFTAYQQGSAVPMIPDKTNPPAKKAAPFPVK